VSILSFGLFGPNGPLPVHMTEYARERIYHHQDSSLSAFADLFHHRLALLFYRAWADAQPAVSLDRADNKRFEGYLASLIGMGQPGQMNKGSLSSHARFTHAGHLTRNGRDPEGLEKILRNYFKAPVKLVSNVPQWMPLSTREQAQLGAGRRMPRMGESAFLGVAVRDVQHKFRIDIGPLSAEEYNRFLPGEAWVTELRDWVRQYAGVEFEWETRVILREDAVQGTTLGSNGRLGYNTWLGRQPQPVPRGDLVYRAER
jgi:type VI secretion system protein ImpH